MRCSNRMKTARVMRTLKNRIGPGIHPMTQHPHQRRPSQPTPETALSSLRRGSWSEARALLTAVLEQLEEDGHSRDKLLAVLMSLTQKGWTRKTQILRVERIRR